MKLLAIDLATTCGFAHSDAAKYSTASGVWYFDGERRLCRLWERLDEIWERHWFNAIALEGAVVPRIGGKGFQVLLEMRGVVKLWAETRGGVKLHENFSPTALKRFATGNGKAEKAAMVAAARRMFREVTVLDDNHADALMLLLFATRELAKETA